MRRALLATALALLAPSPAASQMNPIQTICNAATMDFCMSVFEIDLETLPLSDPSGPMTWAIPKITASFFGPLAVENSRIEWAMDIHTVEYGAQGYIFGDVINRTIPGLTDVEAVNGTINRGASINDLQWLAFSGARPCGLTEEGIRQMGEACYVVPIPEPATWMLLMACLLPLALRARRRDRLCTAWPRS